MGHTNLRIAKGRNMSKTSQGHELRVLILEDIPTDAELLEHELRKGGLRFTARRVESEAAFTEALENFKPHLILADYRLPTFDGVSALRIARKKAADVPFIFVTGAMGEEVAIDTLVSGATDYVLKDRMAKLMPAVERALKEAEESVQHRKAEAALRQRLDEVERLNRLMVGRELKMVDLKKEIALLQQEIAELKGIIEELRSKIEQRS